MGYLGNTPGESFISFAKQVFTIVNSQTAYTLDFAVVDENELRLVINNVVQEPGAGKAYTASGTTLTLASALTNGTDEMYCVFLGKARETVTVPDITRDKLNLISDASNPSLIAKGTSGVSEGYIQLNCAENSHGVKIKSPPHSAGQSYTLTLPQSITNNTFLKTDGSGNLSFANVSSDFVKLASISVTSGTSASIDGYFSSTYKSYMLKISELIYSGNSWIKLKFNVGGSLDTGSTFKWVAEHNQLASGTSTSNVTYGVDNADYVAISYFSGNNGYNRSATIFFDNLIHTDKAKSLTYHSVTRTSGNETNSTTGSAVWNNNSAVSGIVLASNNSNTFVRLEAQLYGLK